MTDDSAVPDRDRLELVTLTGGRKLHVHKREVCAGSVCCIHNPSDHHMINFPQVWRYDIGMMERLCPHGTGHPDPDHMAYVLTQPGPVGERASGVHGCDGCCQPPQPQPLEKHPAECRCRRPHDEPATAELGSADARIERHPYKPTWTIHPGETLGEWMKFTSTTAAGVAAATELPLDRIEAVIAGHAPIDPDMAQRLAVLTGIHVQLWVNLQALYDQRTEAVAGAWKPGDPVYRPEARESSCVACGTTWFPADDTMACPQCDSRGGGS